MAAKVMITASTSRAPCNSSAVKSNSIVIGYLPNDWPDALFARYRKWFTGKHENGEAAPFPEGVGLEANL